jgi:23S rRNA pseudouridine1911/1915/1917 synthase
MTDQNLNHRFIVSESDSNTRLDKFIASNISTLSRTKIKKSIEDGDVLLNGKAMMESDYKVKIGDEISITLADKKSFKLSKHESTLDIVYEDEDIIVINKPSGLTVHPGAGNHQDTLVNILLAHREGALSSGGGNMDRPGIVHRLDKDTSGLMIIAKNDLAHNRLTEMMANREISRTYLSIVYGALHPLNGTIKTQYGRSKREPKKMSVMRSGGKQAITHYNTLEVFGENAASFIECKLETGRTHQIRVHMDHKGHTVVGDQVYGRSRNFNLNSLDSKSRDAIKALKRQALHAYQLELIHPISGNPLFFKVDLPQDMAKILDLLHKGNA